MPQLRIKPTTQACALTRDQTRNILVYGTMLQPTDSLSQGLSLLFRNTLVRIKQIKMIQKCPYSSDILLDQFLRT